MKVYRLAKAAHANDLSGRGAELYGGRWNSRGTAILYTSQSRSLCCVEIAVRTPLGNIPLDYRLISLDIPDTSIEEIKAGALNEGWRSAPHGMETEKIGNKFIAGGKSLILKVPSAVVDGDFNFLLNPSHPKFKEVKINTIENFDFDRRLFE